MDTKEILKKIKNNTISTNELKKFAVFEIKTILGFFFIRWKNWDDQ